MIEIYRPLPLLTGQAFWIALVVGGIFAYPILQSLIALKSRQTVSQYAPEGHQKKQGTPTMGGLIIVVGFLAALAYVWYRYPAGDMPGFLTLFLGFALIGFTDDFIVPRLMPGKRGLGWKQKIAMQFGVAWLALAVSGYGFTWYAFVGWFLILFFSNAYNFADGLDGLAATLGILFFGAIGVIALIAGVRHEIVALSFGFIGAILPFLFFNMPPARVFMGDVGSLPIGAVMGFMVTRLTFLPSSYYRLFESGNERFAGRSFEFVHLHGTMVLPAMFWALVVLSLMMVAELVPVPLQIFSVKLRKKRIFPATPIHHGFEVKGWPESRVVWFFAWLQVLFAAIAIAITIIAATGAYPVDSRILAVLAK